MNTYQVFRDSSEFSSIASGQSQGQMINIHSQTQTVHVPPLNLPKAHTFEMNNDNFHQSSRNLIKNPPSGGSFDSNICTPMLGSSRRLSNDTPGSVNNFESTQDLRSFVVTVDLQKINRDRQNQLKLALEDNLREKDQSVAEALKALNQQRVEYDYVTKTLEKRTYDLENEMLRQRQHISGLKSQASSIEIETKEIHEKRGKLEKGYKNKLAEVIESILYSEREVKGLESELQIMKYEKQTTEQTIEIRRRVRMQELDEKIKPLIEEKEQMELSRDLMLNNLQILQEVKQQNENEKTMIEEDLQCSGQTKMGLIYQREDIEQYIEKTKCDNEDLNFISNLHISQSLTSNWDQVVQQLLFQKQRSLLLDLIRELHQYILGMSSNTTDNSVMQSDELEELQIMIEKKTVLISDAVDLITTFAQSKIKIDLTAEVLQNKLNHVSDQLDERNLKASIQENELLESQMRDIDNRIKVISNRCQNELQPRLKALSLSECQMNDEIVKVELSLQEINNTLAILMSEMSEIKDDFERTQQSLMPKEEIVEDEKLEIKLDNLSQQIQLLEIESESLKQELKELNSNKVKLETNYQEKSSDYENQKINLESRYQEVLEAIKIEKTHVLHYEVTNPKIQELTKIVTQLRCDKESAHKRLKYIEARLANSQESVAHAKQVLDNHILQIQQEQLHQKINQTSTVQFNRRKQSAVHQSSIDPLDSKGSKLDMVPRTPLQDLTNVQNQRKQEPEIFNPNGMPQFNSYGSRGQQNHILVKEDNRRLHMQLMEPDSSDSMPSTKLKSQTKSIKPQNHRDAIYAMLKQDKSAADLVKYNYESSAAISNLDEHSQVASSNRQQAINLVALAKSKNIPIQTLITPRENAQDMMQYNHSHQASIVSQPTQYELGVCNQFMHNSSIGSTDSLCPPSSNKKSQAFMSRQLSVQFNDSPSLKTLQQTMQHSSSVYHQTYAHNPLPSVKISLRDSHTRSIDDTRSFSSSINNFKENIAPNIAISAASSTLNMRKLSQATILLSSSSSQQVVSKPPAVPQGKLLGNEDAQKKSGVIQKNAKANSAAQYMEQQHSSQFSSNSRYQTKMRLCQNSNNGKILAVGIVNLSRCNQTMVQRDIQFFESIKPLIEGAQFLFFSKHGQCQAKHIFLDFSLLRLFITATSSSSLNADRREILMIENIVKPELPQSTLDLIKQEKQGNSSGLGDSQHSSSVSSTSRRYEFHLILNNVNGMLERMQMMTKSYEDLRMWIIGLNALIANKNNLMRLSTMIKS